LGANDLTLKIEGQDMIEYHNSRPARIVDPYGAVLTRDDLPPTDTRRWVASRKAQVVAAVESGLVTIEEVMERYALSFEEYCQWQRAMDRGGVAGLRVCRTQRERALRRSRVREAVRASGRPQLALI
jgi:hypothetical protein